MTGTQTDDTAVEQVLPERLRGLLGGLSDVAVDELGEAALLQVVATLEAAKGAAAALQARATAALTDVRDARADRDLADGVISRREASLRRSGTRAEVALARRCSPGQADRHVGLARALVREMPCTLAALAAGEISEWRATIVVRETACLSREHRIEADRRLAQSLTSAGDRELAAAARRVCLDLDQESVVERRRRAAASRRVTTRPAPDGMAWLSILGPMVDVVGAFAALQAAESARHVATGDERVDAARAADDRGRGAWMADTALELLSGRREGQVQPVEVGLVMNEDVIVPQPGGEAGEDEVDAPGYGPVPGDAVREHLLRLCDEETATWLRRLWTDPAGRDLVAVGSRQRFFTGGLRRLIELRDAVCRVPWCDALTREIDHVEPAARGGPTTAANGLGLCQRHNLVKELPGWSARILSSGLDPGGGPHEVTFTSPTGVEITSCAPPILGRGRERIGKPWQQSAIEVIYTGYLEAA